MLIKLRKRNKTKASSVVAMLKGIKLILAEDVLRISNALGVTPNELLGYDETA